MQMCSHDGAPRSIRINKQPASASVPTTLSITNLAFRKHHNQLRAPLVKSFPPNPHGGRIRWSEATEATSNRVVTAARALRIPNPGLAFQGGIDEMLA
jgi:hypothetical protein